MSEPAISRIVAAKAITAGFEIPVTLVGYWNFLIVDIMIVSPLTVYRRAPSSQGHGAAILILNANTSGIY
ncbi:hypothetical protein MYX84_12995, partial [Acidobacteria bacterium AH-259-O06]|nr:hypothetical protein [Acidobacteria bacterium AH-259-O06]